MKTYSYFVNEMTATQHIRSIVEVYEELAAMRLSAIRHEIVQNRSFFERLEQLAIDVGSDTDPDPETTNIEPKAEAMLLVTANEGLYGDIIEKTFAHFLTFMASHDLPLFVIGKTGSQLMRDYAPRKQFTSFPFSDVKVEETAFNEIVNKVAPYKTVYVFYGKFNSIATQQPVMSTIIGETVNADSDPIRYKKQLKYLYEPSILEVSTLFGSEIKASVFDQILRESQLAKHASRMMHLDTAIEKMNEKLVTLNEQKRQSLKKIAERKQQARIAGLFARGGNRW